MESTEQATKEICPACGDTGEVECDDCDGTGSDCPHCGRGECDACDGTGILQCSCVDDEA